MRCYFAQWCGVCSPVFPCWLAIGELSRGLENCCALAPYWKGIEHFELLGPAQSKLLWFQKILWRSVKYMDLFLQKYWTKFGPPLPQPLFNQVPQLVAVLFKMGCWNPMSFRGLKPSFLWSKLQVLMVDIPIIPFLILVRSQCFLSFISN